MFTHTHSRLQGLHTRAHTHTTHTSTQIATILVNKWDAAARQSDSGGEVDALSDFYKYTFDVCALLLSSMESLTFAP